MEPVGWRISGQNLESETLEQAFQREPEAPTRGEGSQRRGWGHRLKI